MVVRFVGVIRVPLYARVSRVRPVCQKSHTDTNSHSHTAVCVPAPPGIFLPVQYQLNRDKAIFSSRRRNSASKARSDASVRFTGTIQDTGKLQGRKYERQDQPEH